MPNASTTKELYCFSCRQFQRLIEEETHRHGSLCTDLVCAVCGLVATTIREVEG